MLQDIAVHTGSTVITEEMGRTLASTAIKDLGQANKVSSTKDETTIVGGYGKEEEIRARINQIKAKIESSTSGYDSENLQERLAKLAGGVAVIGVGAATETELKEKKHRVEDALSATRAAVDEGVVPGGGVALINAIEEIKDLKDDDPDINTGIDIVRGALEEPMGQLARNAGREGAVIINEVRRRRNEIGFFGYNVMTEAYEDMTTERVLRRSRKRRRKKKSRPNEKRKKGGVLASSSKSNTPRRCP